VWTYVHYIHTLNKLHRRDHLEHVISMTAGIHGGQKKEAGLSW